MSDNNDNTKNIEYQLRSKSERNSANSEKSGTRNALYGEELKSEIQATKEMLSSHKLYSL